MKKIRWFIKSHWFGICVFLILILATVLRFYNFEDRWGLAYDQARDVIVAREAFRTYNVPLIGPFASAGQFVYGPQWFWILILMTGVFPNSIIAPWIIQTLLYIGIVLLMIIIARQIENKLFGIIVGVLAAVSPAQIAQATNLTSPSMVGVVSVISLYFFFKYIKDEKNIYAFLMAFMISTAINIHFQALGLLVLIPVSVIFKKNSFKKIIALAAGIIIPFIPLIIFDLKNSFFESKNMLQYYFHDQYKISFDVLGRRWLTYAGVFWPKAWGYIIGGSSVIGYVEIVCLAAVTAYSLWKRAILKKWYVLIISFLSMLVLIRYTRTPLFDSYLVSLHAFVILLTGWAILLIYKRNVFLGVILLLVIVIGSVDRDIKEIKGGTNYTSLRAVQWKNLLIRAYPGEKFAVYDYGYKSAGLSLPLVLYLDIERKLSNDGHKIGFGSKPKVPTQDHKEIRGNKAGYRLRDLNSSSSAQLKKDGWAFMNPSQIYHSTVGWYMGKKL